jgi:hypothetical protein
MAVLLLHSPLLVQDYITWHTSGSIIVTSPFHHIHHFVSFTTIPLPVRPITERYERTVAERCYQRDIGSWLPGTSFLAERRLPSMTLPTLRAQSEIGGTTWHQHTMRQCCQTFTANALPPFQQELHKHTIRHIAQCYVLIVVARDESSSVFGLSVFPYATQPPLELPSVQCIPSFSRCDCRRYDTCTNNPWIRKCLFPLFTCAQIDHKRHIRDNIEPENELPKRLCYVLMIPTSVTCITIWDVCDTSNFSFEVLLYSNESRL